MFVMTEAIVQDWPAGKIIILNSFRHHVIHIAETCVSQVADVVGNQPVRVVPAKVGPEPYIALAGQERVIDVDQHLARHRRWPGAQGGIRAVIRPRCGLMGERGRPSGQDTSNAVARKTRNSGAQRGASGQLKKLPSIHEAVSSPVQARRLYYTPSLHVGSMPRADSACNVQEPPQTQGNAEGLLQFYGRHPQCQRRGAGSGRVGIHDVAPPVVGDTVAFAIEVRHVSEPPLEIGTIAAAAPLVGVNHAEAVAGQPGIV